MESRKTVLSQSVYPFEQVSATPRQNQGFQQHYFIRKAAAAKEKVVLKFLAANNLKHIENDDIILMDSSKSVPF